MRILFLFLFVFSFICDSQSQVKVNSYFNLDFGRYDVGYRVEIVFDNARTFCNKTDYFGYKHANNNRQIKMHLWYPSEKNKSDQPLTIENYIRASAIGFDHIDNEKDKAEKLNNYKEDLYLHEVDIFTVEAYMSSLTNTFSNLNYPKERHPLIIYAPSINSDPYENLVIIEFLVSYGYVVVSSSCIGYSSPEVTRDAVGAVIQVEDLEFLLRKCWEYDFIDKDNILTLGFSWGGMSNVLFSMKNRNIKGVVSFDGALGYNEYFEIGSKYPFYASCNMTASYLGFLPANEDRNNYLYDSIKYADASLIKIKNVKHKDFSSDGILKKVVTGFEQDKSKYQYLCDFYSELARTTLSFFNKVVEQQDNYLVYNDWMKPISEQVEITHKKKLPVPPTEHEFLSIINTKGAKEAEKLFDSIREKDSTAIFFSERAMINFAYEYGPDRAEELIILLKMNIQLYPNSIDSFLWLAQAYMALNDSSEAKKYIDKILQLQPGNQKASKLLLLLSNS